MANPFGIAVAGAGNIFASAAQVFAKYGNVTRASAAIPGIMQLEIAGYRIGDIETVCVFDVNADKVGKDISEAIWTYPNNARRVCEVPFKGVTVSPGFILDGVGEKLQRRFPLIESAPYRSVVDVLIRSGATMLVCLLPTGSVRAARLYAQACLDAGIGFINGIPVPIAAHKAWEKKFRKKKLPCFGDDWMSLYGATFATRTLALSMRERGIKIVKIVQKNWGHNSDFDNLDDPLRVTMKLLSKKEFLIIDAGTEDIWAGPCGYDEELGHDIKKAEITIHGIGLLNTPVEITMTLFVDDSPNAVGVMLDTIRWAKVALDEGMGGYHDICGYYFKRPMRYMTLAQARKAVDEATFRRALEFA